MYKIKESLNTQLVFKLHIVMKSGCSLYNLFTVALKKPYVSVYTSFDDIATT